jgi:hypothetical protein
MHTYLQKYLLSILLLFSVAVNADQIETEQAVTGQGVSNKTASVQTGTAQIGSTQAETEKNAKNLIQVYRLQYLEREPGVDDYQVTILVSDNKIRVDETGEGSGYIIYDDERQVIYSVSNHDDSILVINEYKFSSKSSPAITKVDYEHMQDAPLVDGKKIFNYRIYTTEGNVEETCMDVHLVENLLPEVRVLLKNYQNIISGQQVKMTDNEITQVQTACYFADQIYNTGSYYDKGLPIQEWHSNERFKVLQSFNRITVKPEIFNVPENYHRFSIDKNSKTFIN